MTTTAIKTAAVNFTQDELELLKLSLGVFQYHLEQNSNIQYINEMSYVLEMIPVIRKSGTNTEFNFNYYQIQGLITSLNSLKNDSTAMTHIQRESTELANKLFDVILDNELVC
jgi:hypothetical protein